MPASLDDLLGDRRRGAVAIALDAATLLAGLDRASRERAARALVEAHPAMAPLRLLARQDDPAAFAAALRLHLDEAAHATTRLIEGQRVLTISDSTTVEHALRLGRPREVHCLRSMPGGEGGALAERLGARLWEDEDLALAAARADIGLAGADAVGPAAFVNKVGTAALCRALPTWLLAVPEKRLSRSDFDACARATGGLFEVVPLDLVRDLSL